MIAVDDSRPILVIDDDPGIRAALTEVLRAAGYCVITRHSGDDGLAAAVSEDPCLVLLDLGLPDVDGSDVLTTLRRASTVPVMVLSGRSSEVDKARELTAGADDYLVKPFGNLELLARVNAVLRRAPPNDKSRTALVDGTIVVDLRARTVTVAGGPVALSRTEFALLTLFLQEPGRALGYNQILRRAWNDVSGVGPDRIKFTVRRLRTKLGHTEGRRLTPVRSVGYRWDPPAGGRSD